MDFKTVICALLTVLTCLAAQLALMVVVLSASGYFRRHFAEWRKARSIPPTAFDFFGDAA